MTISMDRAKEAIEEMTQNGVNPQQVGFVATVLRDNAKNDFLHDYYQLVVDYVEMNKKD